MSWDVGSSRRGILKFSKYSKDQLEFVLPINQRARAEFEDTLGYPTNIDAVWNAREANQNFKNKERLVTHNVKDFYA
jgi:hypothetical protein